MSGNEPDGNFLFPVFLIVNVKREDFFPLHVKAALAGAIGATKEQKDQRGYPGGNQHVVLRLNVSVSSLVFPTVEGLVCLPVFVGEETTIEACSWWPSHARKRISETGAIENGFAGCISRVCVLISRPTRGWFKVVNTSLTITLCSFRVLFQRSLFGDCEHRTYKYSGLDGLSGCFSFMATKITLFKKTQQYPREIKKQKGNIEVTVLG